MLTLCWPKLPLSCPMLTLCSPMLALEMLSPIAVTETTEVGTGWGRGPPTRSAAGAAALYNLRLLPKASGKDTGWAWGRLTAGRRPKGGYVGLSWTYLGPKLPLCSPMLAVCWPMSALCWPKLALSCPYVGLMVAYVGAMLA